VLVLVCFFFMSHVQILASVNCLIMWRLCAFERPCVAVAPCWSPIRSSRSVALSSWNVMSVYISPSPGMPRFRQNSWESGMLLSFGRATCDSVFCGLCVVVCCLGIGC